MKHRTRRIAKRWLAMVLCLCMIFPSAGTFASAAEKSAYTGGLCEHHPEHTPECGYTEAVEGQPCAHVHDESCGYSEPTEEIPCTHSHDESCGYQAAVAEIPCDKGCTNTDENGNIIHQEGCAYQPAVEEQPCTHEHDETCGYQTAVEGSPCTHIHDEGCGYVEAVEEQPCSFICEICSKEQDVNPQQDDGNLFPGYVSKLVVSGMTDGTAPFDSDDTAGNDSSGNNQIVRSYDNIRYDLTASFAARTAEATASSAKLWYEMTLNTDVLAATYDTSQMKWLQNNYTIEYLDQNGNTLYSRDGDEGAYYIWESGAKTDRALNSLNDIAKGSTAGTESYTTAIASQRLTGWTMVTGSSDNANVLSGTKTFSAGVQVLNAEQGTKFQPTFKVWLDGNEENKGAIDDGGDGSPVLENIVTADVVTASADARYNVEFKKNSDLNYRSWFDFFTGDELTGSSTVSYSINGKTLTGADIYRLLEALSALEENHGKSDPSKYTANAGTIDESLLCGLALADYKEVFSNIRYGRMTGYGLTLQLYNAADDTDNLSAKGLRGMNLPVGDVTFDLNLKLTATNDNNQPFDEDGNYTILLWDYNRNIPSNVDYGTRTVDDHSVTIYKGDTGWDRNMYWNGESRSPYARGCGPYNYQFATSSSTVNKSYWGGDWGMTWSGSGGAASSSESDGMIPGDVTGDGSSASYHFRVSGFDFDFSDLAGMNFPTNRAGSSLIQSGWNSYIGCFSAGYIQTLNVFPRYQTQTVNLASELKVDNFSAQTRAGDAIINETLLTDNALTDKIELYASGSLAKGNSFTKLGSQSMSTNYLGTDYWLTSYDCSVYAGDTVALLGYGLLSATSDYRIRAMNLLQLFDSRVLSVAADDTTYTADGGPYSALDLSNGGNPGTTTILYAADPDHKGGYDTVDGCDGLSGNEVMQYMNEVREEDLVYYTSLEALENDGYTCIGVLMELRDCDLSAGTYQHLTVPVRINGDDPALINQTAGTVNTVRVWCGEGQMSGVSWADGAWDSETEKNTLDGYVEITGSAGADGYSAKVENTKYYEKTRYENGKWAGGHTNGTPYGNTLLILGYDQDGIRPESITVKLLADGADTEKTAVLSEGNNWTDTFTGLDEYKDGEKIVYTIKEVSVEGYESVITGDVATGFIITNSHTPATTEVSGSKTWDDADNQDGKRPESITIRLLANGQEKDSKTVTAENGWKWSFTNLPKYENGQVISYTITEDTVTDYTTTVNGYDVTNSYTPGKTSVTVTKTWSDAGNQDGIRPAEVIVELLANGEPTGKTLTLSTETRWMGIFTELDEYKGGEKIVYSVKEISVEGYESVISGDAATGFIITNSHTPETIVFSGSKTWDDADNQDGKRPQSITIRLYANGKEMEVVTVTAENGWAWEFNELPKYENGNEIRYTITEEAVDGYQSEIDGMNVTNHYTPGKINIPVTKNWQDKDDADGIRPDSITVKLYADGTDTGRELILDQEHNWTGSFDDLDEYADGVKIVYTIAEVKVEGYDTSISGSMETGFVITNSHTPYIPEQPSKPEQPKENGDTPKTGDTTNLALWLGLLAISGTGLTAALLLGKKKRHHSKHMK